MEQLDLIRTTHEIDRSLSRVATAVTDEHLKKEIIGVQTMWRELAYAVTADLCGIGADSPSVVKRRGRRRHAEGSAGRTDENQGRASA